MFEICNTAERVLTVSLRGSGTFNQVIAVNGGRDCGLGESGRDELEDSHLGSGILHGNTIRTKTEIADTTLDFLAFRVVEMSVDDLFREGQRTVETAANNLYRGREREIKLEDNVNGVEQDLMVGEKNCVQRVQGRQTHNGIVARM